MVTKRRTSGPGLLRPETKGSGGPSGPGRPPIYHDGLPHAAFKMALLGATEDEMASVFGVDATTFSAWKNDYPAFSKALRDGKLPADANMAHSLYQRGIGYTHQAEKIFHADGQITRARYTEHYPPDTGAAKLWLTNRRGGQWRERVEHAGDPTQPVVFQIIRAGGKG